MNLNGALDEFLLACKADGLAVATVKWYKSTLKAMIKHLDPDTSVTAVTTRDMRLYIVSLRERTEKYQNAKQKPMQNGPLSIETINAHLRALHRFWRWSSTEFQCHNPMNEIKRPKQGKPRIENLTIEDWKRMLARAGNDDEGIRNRAILFMLADTGCRSKGLLALTTESLNLLERYALTTEKGDKRQKLLFTSVTALAVSQWLQIRPQIESTALFTTLRYKQNRPMAYHGLYELIKRIGIRAGIDASPHKFRHAFARQYLMNGGDLSSLSKILGHANIGVTNDFYAIFGDRDLQNKHDDFSPVG